MSFHDRHKSCIVRGTSEHLMVPTNLKPNIEKVRRVGKNGKGGSNTKDRIVGLTRTQSEAIVFQWTGCDRPELVHALACDAKLMTAPDFLPERILNGLPTML